MNKLLEYFEAERGRRIRLAEQLGIRPSAISMWKTVPIERVNEIERVTGIPREELRPDIFIRVI